MIAGLATILASLTYINTAHAETVYDANGNFWDEAQQAWTDGVGHWYKWGHWRNADDSVYKLPDGNGHFWFWGAWRYADGTLYVPVPDVAVSYRASAGVEQWRPLVASIFPASSVDKVLSIMTCESGGNPNATGASGERGLMQIATGHHDSTYDPEGNLRAAYRISSGGTNWGPWTCA